MLNIYIVGPSCGGKTTMLHYVREHTGPMVVIPKRMLTRPPRNPHDPLENGFMVPEAFARARAESQFFISWERIFSETRTESYGFYARDVSEEKINVFSGNNSLFLNPDSISPHDIFTSHETHFVICNASPEIRKMRLKERSPEYSEEEVMVRIYKEPIEPFLSHADLLLDSATADIEENGARLVKFIHLVARE